MANLIDIRPATLNSNLLNRIAAALENVASQAFAAATGPNDTNLAWVKRAWLRGPGQDSMIPWYAQRALEHAVQTVPGLADAITANPASPAVIDSDIQAFCRA